MTSSVADAERLPVPRPSQIDKESEQGCEHAHTCMHEMCDSASCKHGTKSCGGTAAKNGVGVVL